MERIRNIQEEWLRLGGSDAERAERELLQRGPRSKPDTPIKDLEDGALVIRRLSFGYDEGWQSTEADANRVKLMGYHVLRSASVRCPQDTPEPCQIYMQNEDQTNAVTLEMGEADAYPYLTMKHELWLQGTWYLDARQMIGFDRASGSTFDVVAQRIQRGLE